MILTLNQLDAIKAKLKELLPHGSGIDCEWQFETFGKLVDPEYKDTVTPRGERGQHVTRLRVSNHFHCMNEHGYYDGYAHFSITIYPLKALSAFRFQFHGVTAQRKNKKYQLRDYLEETIYEALKGNHSLLQLAS